ncbi:MAG: FAD:protein FMN transferase [Planctomycetota bacterium]|jgi:thiamine biosynthesis lipoprotein
MHKRRRVRIEVIVGVCLILVVYFFATGRDKSVWSGGRVEVDSSYRLVMGTLARVVAVAADTSMARGCIESAFAEIENVDRLMSTYKSESEVSEINRDGFKRAVKVSRPTYEVLKESIEFSKLSSGAFDITVGPLVDIWRRAEEANSVPSDEELAEARSKVGYEKLMLDDIEMTIRFAVDGMKLDLGGIAKGYAIDKAARAMQRAGATGGMVDIGGDIRCFGVPRGKDRWVIGLQDPSVAKEELDAGETLLILKLTDCAIATSGGYRRFVSIGGKKYSHILDAGTGYGSSELASVTVISKNAIESDALATAVSVLGAEKGLVLIEERPDTEAILISSGPEYQITKSSGVGKYIE